MRLEAWEDMQAQQPPEDDPWPKDYQPGYDPDEDPTYDLRYKPSYSADLQLASMNYWAGKTGQMSPPPPTFDGGRLGRYVDVYGAQAWMRHVRHYYLSERYVLWGLVALSLGLSWMAGPFGFACAVVFGAGALGLLLVLKRRCSRIFDRFYDVQAQILQTGEPVWVPYSASQLRAIRRNPKAIWP